MKKENIQEIVEAALIMGVRRGSAVYLRHDDAKAKIEQSIESMTGRFLMLEDLETEKLKEAIKHLLLQIRNNPKLRYEIGEGTETFNLITEAASMLFDESIEQVQKLALGTNEISN
jgi:hypothetical protein